MANRDKTLYLSRRDTSRYKTFLTNKKKQIKFRTSDLIHDRAKKISQRAKRYINSRTHGEGDLANAISMKSMRNREGITWQIYTNGKELQSKTGRDYSDHVDDGYTPHVVTVVDKPKLMRWIGRNLGFEELKKLVRANKMSVGFRTPWNRSSGLNYSGYMFNIARSEIPKDINKKIGRLIK